MILARSHGRLFFRIAYDALSSNPENKVQVIQNARRRRGRGGGENGRHLDGCRVQLRPDFKDHHRGPTNAEDVLEIDDVGEDEDFDQV